MMLMGYWSCAVQPGTAMTAHGDDEVRRHKGCRTFLLRPRAPRPSDPELPHAEANLPTRYPTHRKQRGGFFSANNSDINEDCTGAVHNCHVTEAIGGLKGSRGRSAYSASKHAVIALTRSAAL